jgi:hypothetical protein
MKVYKTLTGQQWFKNIDEDCDKRIETKINFNYGIPKSIFRKCSTELGDAYNFEE